ncbi:MAG: hypothetical protein ACWGQW_02045 [bacterium]
MSPKITLKHPPFDGETYGEEDYPRLKSQLEAVRKRLKDGKWHTIQDLAEYARNTTGRQVTEASISARIRDLRKKKFGGYTVWRLNYGNGLWKYKMDIET